MLILYLFAKEHLLLRSGIALELSRILEASDRSVWATPPLGRFREHSFRQGSRARVEFGTSCTGAERHVFVVHHNFTMYARGLNDNNPRRYLRLLN